MKKILITLIIASSVLFSCKKSSSSDTPVVTGCSKGNGSGNTVDTVGTVYGAGYIVSATTSKKIAAYWRGTTLVNLSNGVKNAYATGITMLGNDVYVCGFEENSANTYVAKYWKNGTAVNITDGTKNAYANSIKLSGTDVYVAGSEQTSGSNAIAKYWKNGTAVNLTDGTKYAASNAITLVGTDVYVAGNEDVLAKYWKNGVAVTLPTTNTSPFSATSIAFSGSDVYIGGFFSTPLAISGVAFWKNNMFTALPTTTGGGQVNAIAVSNGNIYVGGNDNNNAVYWKNNVAMQPEASPATGSITSVTAICDNIYFGGYKYSASLRKSVATIWALGSTTVLSPTVESQVSSIFVVN